MIINTATLYYNTIGEIVRLDANTDTELKVQFPFIDKIHQVLITQEGKTNGFPRYDLVKPAPRMAVQVLQKDTQYIREDGLITAPLIHMPDLLNPYFYDASRHIRYNKYGITFPITNGVCGSDIFTIYNPDPDDKEGELIFKPKELAAPVDDAEKDWLPIETAPKLLDRPIWVRGRDRGDENEPYHHGWARYDTTNNRWVSARTVVSIAELPERDVLSYISHWLKLW